jgi:hypothetical protein
MSPLRLRLTQACVVIGLLVAGLVPALACAAPAVPATATPTRAPTVRTLSLGPTHTLTISAVGLDVELKSTVTTKRTLDTTQRTMRYTLGRPAKPSGVLTLTLRTLPSGSKLVFAELEARDSTPSVTLSVSSASDGALLHDLRLEPNLKPNKVQGVDLTSGPVGWVDFSRGAASDAPLFLSKAYRYDVRTKTYPRGGTSTVRELISETASMSVDQGGGSPAAVVLDLAASGRQHAQRYFLISSAPITDSARKASTIAYVTGAEWRWLDPLGSYDKAPYSIEPTTRRGYVRSLLDMRGGKTLAAYRATKSRLFGDLLANDLYTLGAFRSRDGLWRTDYTSTWVKGESGIVAPYVDTRHNEHLSQRSFSIAGALGSRGVIAVAECTKWADEYAKYLSGLEARGAVVRTEHGILFADYYDPTRKLKVHTSLNHALGEMNYLYDMYTRTADHRYVELAEQIRAGIDDTAHGWIRPNHDLYYQRNIDGTFSGTDYRVVTYLDLLGARMRIFAIMGAIDPAIESMVASKALYLGLNADRMLADADPPPTGDGHAPQPEYPAPPRAFAVVPQPGYGRSRCDTPESPVACMSAGDGASVSSASGRGSGGFIASG